jgi:hypothetical protein
VGKRKKHVPIWVLVEDALLFLSLLDNHLHGRIQNIRSPIKFDLAGMCESTLSSSRDV